jgi:uncharacterized membrane protein
MNNQNEIKQLEKELLQLHQQLKEQQQQLSFLYNRLKSLSGAEKVVARPSGASRDWSLENFIGLRIIHLIGIVVLVIGLSIGVKYAIDRNLISEAMRIGLAYAAGISLYILSVRLKSKYSLFSAILFSGGMASLYFTTYGAYAYYGMMPFAVAFLIMIALTVFTVYQAIVYDQQEIALLGLVGAYAIPFLISKNTGRADLFFSYITIINVGVVYVCLIKPWRNVGRVAQVISWILFIGWAATRFDIQQQWVGLAFMSVFFLLFMVHGVSDRVFHRRNLIMSNNQQIVINNLALYIASLFVLGSSFVKADLAMVTIGVAIVAAFEALLFHYAWQEKYTARIVEGFSFLLFIIFIAFQWSGLTVTLLWLLVAIIVFALGVIKKGSSFRMASIVLMGATLLKLVAFDSLTFSTVQKVISYLVLGVLLLVVSYFYQKYKQQLFSEDNS